MSHPDYCPARHDTPGHACLCVKDAGHHREHLCICGYTWHPDWAKLTYEQQRQMLGLMPWPGLADFVRSLRYEQRVGVLDTIEDVYQELSCLIPGADLSPLIDTALEEHAAALDELADKPPRTIGDRT